MPHQPEDTDIDNWHRFFAIETNNRAWELAELPERTEDQTAEMLNCAHAAALHWRKIGTELNDMRAKLLLAHVHALVGFGDSALALSTAVRNFFLQRETDDWEIAFVHTIHAEAALAARDVSAYEHSYPQAKAAIDAIADDADREIVLQTFNQIPEPGSA